MYRLHWSAFNCTGPGLSSRIVTLLFCTLFAQVIISNPVVQSTCMARFFQISAFWLVKLETVSCILALNFLWLRLIFCLCLPSAEVTSMHHHAQNLTGFTGVPRDGGTAHIFLLACHMCLCTADVSRPLHIFYSIWIFLLPCFRGSLMRILYQICGCSVSLQSVPPLLISFEVSFAHLKFFYFHEVHGLSILSKNFAAELESHRLPLPLFPFLFSELTVSYISAG